MLVSYSHRFIFFHVGKTGGMSLREVLQSYAEEPEKFKIRRPPETIDGKPNAFYEVWQTLLLHAKARDARKELPKDIFDGFYKFAFVRNPWDLQVSMYHFILREPASSTHAQVKAAGSFEGFLDWVSQTPAPYPKGISKLQRDMITDSQGNLLVDFVGRYESLASDFEKLRLQLGIQARLPHMNRSQHRDYRSYYNERTLALVADLFRADIEMFGYGFDQVVSQEQLANPGELL